MADLYSDRAKVPKRGAYSAPVDTAGMDQSMKDTMLSMRGPGGGSRPQGDPTHQGAPPKGPDAFSRFMAGFHGLVSGKPKAKPALPDTMSRATEDSLSKKLLGK